MKEREKILFVGSYYSAQKGSISRAEELKELLMDEVDIQLTSYKEKKIVRILDIIQCIVFFKGKKIIIDTYSGQAFLIAEIASFITLLRGKELVLILRGGMLTEFHRNYPKRVSKLLNRTTHIFTPSFFLKEYFTSLNYSVSHLTNWIDLRHFGYMRDTVIPFSLLWVRAFTDIYNPWLAVKVLNEVRKKFPEAILTMVGPDKGLLNEIKNLIKELNLIDAIKIVGPVQNKELHKYYQTHSVYLNTTSYESFGVALVEAAACGIPMVSSNVGEIPYIWKDGDDILLCESRNVEDFTQKTIDVLENKNLAERLSHHAYQKAQQFNWHKIKPKWSELLKSSST